MALTAAASFIYTQITGTTIDPVPAMNKLLDEVAHAMSNVSPIYGVSVQTGVPSLVDPLDLMHGTFERGATFLRTPGGPQYRHLSIRRDDMVAAIAILKRAGTTFLPKSRPGTR